MSFLPGIGTVQTGVFHRSHRSNDKGDGGRKVNSFLKDLPFWLEIINNALNEVCNGIDLEGEFDTRMGCTLQEALQLLAKIHALAAGR